MSESKKDAAATARTGILSVIAYTTGELHTMTPDQGGKLADQIIAELSQPSMRWALAVLGRDDD